MSARKEARDERWRTRPKMVDSINPGTIDRMPTARTEDDETQEWIDFTPEPRGSTVTHRPPFRDYRYWGSARAEARLTALTAVEAWAAEHCAVYGQAQGRRCDDCFNEPGARGLYGCPFAERNNRQ